MKQCINNIVDGVPKFCINILLSRDHQCSLYSITRNVCIIDNTIFNKRKPFDLIKKNYGAS